MPVNEKSNDFSNPTTKGPCPWPTVTPHGGHMLIQLYFRAKSETGMPGVMVNSVITRIRVYQDCHVSGYSFVTQAAWVLAGILEETGENYKTVRCHINSHDKNEFKQPHGKLKQEIMKKYEKIPSRNATDDYLQMIEQSDEVPSSLYISHPGLRFQRSRIRACRAKNPTDLQGIKSNTNSHRTPLKGSIYRFDFAII
ncbi:hypothetical protein Tco_0514459 [Tanacetum coccineum]